MRVTKTWAVLIKDIEESLQRWGAVDVKIACILPSRSTIKAKQTAAESTVTLTFRRFIKRYSNQAWMPVKLIIRRHDRAIENLTAIAHAVEHLRMIDVHGVRDLTRMIDEQLYPTQVSYTDPFPAPPPPAIPDHYRILGVLPDAPIEVIEAAYKAQARRCHPDTGGDTATMQRINSSMDRIRKEREKV
jgi:hypothetical protein